MTSKRIQLADCIYIPATHAIIRDDKEVLPRLTPSEAKILEFLYNNNDRPISRSELLQVAVGKRIVGENIITQYIRSIRKALGDSASNPKYIRTLQKEGYHFIASVKELTDNKKLAITYWLFPVIIITLITLYFIQPDLLQEDTAQMPVPMTTLKGQELFGDTSPNGEYIVFSHKEPNQPFWNIVLKKISEEKYYQLTEDNINDRQVKFSPSGNQLMYHHYDAHVNQINIAQINWLEKRLENIKVQVDIPQNLFTVYLEWKDENNILYSSQDKPFLPVQIFSHNIETKTREILTSPPNNGMGDLALTYSKHVNKLAFLRNVAFSKTNIMVYDFDSGLESKVLSLPMEPFSIDWIRKGTNLIVSTGNNKIGLLSLKDNKLVNIINNFQPIYGSFVIDDNNIAYTEGAFMVLDIEQGSLLSNGENLPIISSAYNDYRPAYAQISGSMAFVSTRTGVEQIWLRSFSGKLMQISHFRESTDIQNLAINAQGNYIAYTTNAELHVIEIETGKSVLLLNGDNDSHHNPVFSFDGEDLIYTIKNNGKWQLEKRKLNNIKLSTFITYANIAIPSKNAFYFMKPNDPKLYQLDQKGIIVDTEILLDEINYVDQVDVIDNFIYYTQSIDGKIKLMVYDFILKTKKEISSISSLRFSLNHKELFYYATQNIENDTNIKAIFIKD